MSTFDDPFEEIISGLGEELDTQPDDIIDVTELPDIALVHMFSEITDELINSEQIMEPNTEWAREQHSLRVAMYREMKKRGLR